MNSHKYFYFGGNLLLLLPVLLIYSGEDRGKNLLMMNHQSSKMGMVDSLDISHNQKASSQLILDESFDYEDLKFGFPKNHS